MGHLNKSEGTVIIDKRGTIKAASKVTLKIFGYKKHQIIGV